MEEGGGDVDKVGVEGLGGNGNGEDLDGGEGRVKEVGAGVLE